MGDYSEGDEQRPSSPEAVRLRAVLEMNELAISLYRQRMRREHPAASEGEVEEMVRAWVQEPRQPRTLPAPPESGKGHGFRWRPVEGSDQLLGLRRGALSLAGVATEARADLRAGREQDALRLLYGFADDFRGSAPAGKAHLIREEPPSTGVERFDAALAATAEFFANEAGMGVPRWTQGPGRFASPWWFIAPSPAFHAYVLAHTPVAFFRHGVFIAWEVFDRV